MRIEVKLHALLRKFAPKKDQTVLAVELREGATIQDLLGKIAVPAEKARLIVVNGLRCNPSDKLTDGAVVDLFPPLAGG